MSFSVSAISGGYAPQAMTGASARMPPAQKMATLFSKIDVNGTGSINQNQFQQAFQSMNPPVGFRNMGPSAVFSALNPNSSGAVTKQDFVQGMTQLMAQIRSGSATG